jgi:hypothetical protein
MKNSLDDAEILNILREEWKREVSALLEKHGKRDKPEKKKPKNVRLNPDVIEPLASGLRVKHKDSGFEYTVLDVVDDMVFLLTPEGEEISLPKMRLKREYILD